VISTAVFPSVGSANPTLTLAALSLRAAGAIARSL
jgi:choline dehydrogenase-like flavoprotein